MLKQKFQNREALPHQTPEGVSFNISKKMAAKAESLKPPEISELLKFAKEGYLHADHIYEHPDGLVFYTTNFIAKIIERTLFQNGYTVEIHPIGKDQYAIYIPEQFRDAASDANWYLWERGQANTPEVGSFDEETNTLEPAVQIEEMPEDVGERIKESDQNKSAAAKPAKPISFSSDLKNQINGLLSGKIEASDFEQYINQMRKDHQALIERGQKAA